MSKPGIELANRDLARALLPPPELLISEWAERYGVLAAESSSEPGRWTAIPYQIAMMDACCHPEIERITVKKSARIGYTKIVGHLIGYHVHQDPCSILVVLPTIDDAEGWSKEELTPTVEQTDVLRELIAPMKARSTGNTILRKSYPGGIIHAVGANSARGFRRITVRIVIFDETDGYPPSAGSEGDQEKLGETRAATAWNRKIIKGSTPTDEDGSRIDRSWKESSQGHYVLTCPACGGEHIRRLLPPDKPIIIRGESMPVSALDMETAHWICPACSHQIPHRKHRSMIAAGWWKGEDWEWRHGTGFELLPTFRGHIGFHLWAGYGYSPHATPRKLIDEYLQVRDDPELHKTFVNTVLGETWSEPGEQLDADVLAARAEKYPAEVPDGVVWIDAGVDVQGDRLELEVVGWGAGEESWSLDYQVLIGDPAQDDVWRDLEDVWESGRWARADGTQIRLSAMAIDSGYLPRRVYRFCAKLKAEHVYPIKGRAGAYPVIEDRTLRVRRRAKRARGGAAPELVGVDEAKTILFRRLRGIIAPGPGFCHFPEGRPLEWYRQLTAAKLVTRYQRGGRVIREWLKSYIADEALDCRNYAYAALLLAGPDLRKPRSAARPAAEQQQRQNARPPRRQSMPAGRLIR
jgi:phage terminase large subunit GpA-like protein